LNEFSVDIARQFNLPEQRIQELKEQGEARSGKALPDLNLWFRVTLKSAADAAAFLRAMNQLDFVELIEPAPLPAPPPTTPDFTDMQGYLTSATDGIDALFSWSVPGGNGSSITIFDVEYNWNQTHEDLSALYGLDPIVNPGDEPFDPFGDMQHGTAVMGEMVADFNDFGVTGISWGANIGLVPADTRDLGYNVANAIALATAAAAPGDVILIEQQLPVCGLSSYGPSEGNPAVFMAIQTAVANRVSVVEAAGNGSVDLDQPQCDGYFDRTIQDSGAIIVGAGGPPSGGRDRQRESFSTYGSRVDAQGWGSRVTTTGYGSLYRNPEDPGNQNYWYTSTFNGTSSASPIVAGAVANIQGVAKLQFGEPLLPDDVRALIVDTGSPQLGAPEHIGPRPDLQAALCKLLGC
jgi:subtilisin family serine protease